MLWLKSRLFLLFALCCQLIEVIILRLPCKEYGNFSITKSEHSLPGSLLATFTNKDVNECERECLLHAQCKSINTNTASKSCELNSNSTADYTTGFKTLVSRAGWTYRSTNDSQALVGENCEYWKPCRSSYQCLDTCSCSGYQCIKIRIAKTATDCQTLYERGFSANAVYQIQATNETIKFPVFCDMTTENDGWIVFQRRMDNSVDFFLSWNDYKQGFGNLQGNFWLGLDKLHLLASSGKGAILRVDIEHREVGKRYAQYSTFVVGDEASQYILTVDGFQGNTGDSLSYHNRMKFSTKDRDNDETSDKNCAVAYYGGWWYKSCHHSNLNGLFPTNQSSSHPKYMTWLAASNSHGEIVFSEMKLKYIRN